MQQDPEINIDVLTERERQVLKLVADGMSTDQIAVMLNLSPGTIQSHRNSLRNKLHVHNLAGMIRYAIKFNLIQ